MRQDAGSARHGARDRGIGEELAGLGARRVNVKSLGLEGAGGKRRFGARSWATAPRSARRPSLAPRRRGPRIIGDRGRTIEDRSKGLLAYG